MPPKRKLAWHKPFLASLKAGSTLKDACAAAGISKQNAYQARQRDEAFAVAWAEAWEDGAEVMEAELFRRAVTGIDKPVYQGGKLVGVIREYSDTLLIFGLKARKPETYRENQRIEHVGAEDAPGIEVVARDDRQAGAAAADFLRRVAGS